MNFEKCLELKIDGWKNPLTVNYCFEVISGITWLFWKVEERDHVFKILYQTVVQRHFGNLEEHFSLVLKTFRNDYKEWQKEDFSQDWMKKYKKLFSDLIL